MRVKICGITRPEEGVAAAQAGADAIGLVFYSASKRAVTVGQAQTIVRALPPYVSVVGLFVNATPEAVVDIASQVPLDMLQFHGDESADFCQQFDRPWCKALSATPMETLSNRMACYAGARGILLDSVAAGQFGGSGHVFDWQQLPGDLPAEFILAGGLDPANVEAAVKVVRPIAVDVSSGVEAAPGVKDPEKMRNFVARARAAAEELLS